MKKNKEFEKNVNYYSTICPTLELLHGLHKQNVQDSVSENEKINVFTLGGK